MCEKYDQIFFVITINISLCFHTQLYILIVKSPPLIWKFIKHLLVKGILRYFYLRIFCFLSSFWTSHSTVILSEPVTLLRISYWGWLVFSQPNVLGLCFKKLYMR